VRFSIYINQPMCIDLGLTMADGAVFGCIYDAQAWATKIVINGEVWVWISKSKFTEELPLVGGWETFKKRKQTLKEKGLIKYTVSGNKQLLKLTELGQKWNESSGVKSYPSSDEVGLNLTPVLGLNLTPNTLTTNTLPVTKKNKQKKNADKPKTEFDFKAEIVAIHLDEKIKSINPKAQTNSNAWLAEIEKAIRIDGRSVDDLIAVIDWIYTPAGNFWKAFVMSGKKLREKFDTIQMQMIQGNSNGSNGNQQFGSSTANETPAQRIRRLNEEDSERVRSNPNRTRSTADHF